tara:strand:+ start:874 stop:1053 length:180 start_codon:yes stop_codon:yes gene_type:complete
MDMRRSGIDFYEWMLKTGRIQEGGAAHQRLLFLKEETKMQRQSRLNRFLAKRQKEKNGV